MNAFYLKIIALITMIVDHIGAVFFPDILLFRYVGRIAFPLYAFLVSEGCKKTKNFKKYLMRLFIFALISEIFFDLTFYNSINIFYNNNTIFTLFFASLIIYIINCNNSKNLKLLIIFLVLLLVETLSTDYGIWGIFLVLLFYFFKERVISLIFVGILIMLKDFDYSIYYFLNTGQIYKINLIFNTMTLVPLYLIYKYNGEKGISMKYFFYWAYPLHFLIILIIKSFILI